MSGGTEYAEALVRAEAEIARLRRELERRAGAAPPAPRDANNISNEVMQAVEAYGDNPTGATVRDLTDAICRWGHSLSGAAPRDGDDYDHSIHTNPDARAWAAFFAKTFPTGSSVPDEATMLGWFANAMMAMHDHLRAAPRDEDPVRRALIAMGERWHACNKGRAPSEAENERRKCARELLRFARALAPPSPPSGPDNSSDEEGA